MAYIGRTPTNAALTASDLADGIVTTAKIDADAVTDAKIADDVVGTEHLTANEVDTTALGADAVTGAQLADDAVNSEHYTDGSIDTAHIADGQVTTAKLASAVFTGATDIGAAIVDADLFLMDDGAGGTIRKTTASRLKTYAGGGTNTPAFMAKQTGTQNINNTTWTKVQFNAEVFDTDGTYDHSSNYRWTPGVAGKYFMYLGITIDDLDDGKRLATKVYKNGVGVAESLTLSSSGVTEKNSNTTSFIDIADDDDYYEAYVYHDIGSAEDIRTDYQSIFMGYKIIE
jgi:hypothetical protein